MACKYLLAVAADRNAAVDSPTLQLRRTLAAMYGACQAVGERIQHRLVALYQQQAARGPTLPGHMVAGLPQKGYAF
jgi:hypothetical protein